ncbi:2-succinylbenzoyl-CoA synthetase [Ectothiorhodosinus mongolicus]|uniref:2-succinylbenzoyl-CoA synthetase n=1 Tax=Ectothiorhodosinus mongolicus TaxID=233100 RepID=A0A1R3W035_9GAMM|nr:2-succinylbenzoate--CoA ligase [Ectothiorhodosinus mongolicus]SIT70902.1 2-succinylbenzoyl-CoA synthetase [Ectothiorhodosinus mongolicus]
MSGELVLTDCLLSQAAERHPGSVAACGPDIGSVDYHSLHTRVSLRAKDLQQQGLRPQTWVVLQASTDLQTLIDLLAVARAGAWAVPINSRLPPAYLEQTLIAAQLHHFSLVPGQSLTPMPSSSTAAPHLKENFAADEPWSGILTSGSSGIPKLAVHSHENLVRSAQGANTLAPLDHMDRYLLSLPLYHVSGLAIVFRCMLAGAAMIFGEQAQDGDFLSAWQVTHLSLVETQLRRLLQAPRLPSTLSQLLIGGGPADPQLLQQAADRGLSCWMSYGLTEMTAQVWTRDPQGKGHLLPHRELCLADSGEILVRGQTLFLGYWRGQSLDPARDADGWFHTGDLGRWENGELCVVGRADNQFISGGENIQPESIERILKTHPDILEAIVVPYPDPVYGERPMAFVTSNNPIATEQLQAWLGTQLPSFMLPLAFLPMPEQTGIKPRRRELQLLALQALPYQDPNSP